DGGLTDREFCGGHLHRSAIGLDRERWNSDGIPVVGANWIREVDGARARGLAIDDVEGALLAAAPLADGEVRDRRQGEIAGRFAVLENQAQLARLPQCERAAGRLPADALGGGA